MQEQVQAALVSTTRSAGQISSEDLSFQRSLNPDVGEALDEASGRLLALSTSLLKSAASISELRAPALEDADDVENNWRSVVDVIDSLLEKTDTCLDEYTGMIKRKDQPTPDQVHLISEYMLYLETYFHTVTIKSKKAIRKCFPDSELGQAAARLRYQAKKP